MNTTELQDYVEGLDRPEGTKYITVDMFTERNVCFWGKKPIYDERWVDGGSLLGTSCFALTSDVADWEDCCFEL